MFKDNYSEPRHTSIRAEDDVSTKTLLTSDFWGTAIVFELIYDRTITSRCGVCCGCLHTARYFMNIVIL